MLPLARDALLVGSCDGGHTIHADAAAVRLTAFAFLHLHLAGHAIRPLGGGADAYLFGPGDIECHRGLTGQSFLLDLGRLPPPEDPKVCTHLPHNRAAVFFRMLRFEYLAKRREQGLPRLSSDALTPWGKHSDPSHDRNATAASKDLCIVEVASVAQQLTEEYQKDLFSLDGAMQVFIDYNPDLARCVPDAKAKWSEAASQADFDGATFWSKVKFELQKLWWEGRQGPNPMDCPLPAECDKVHNRFLRDVDLGVWFLSAGVNMRHLGLVRDRIDVHELRQRLLEEVIVRSLKSMLRAKMRDSGADAKEAVASFIGLLLATTTEAEVLWSVTVSAEVRARFGDLALAGIQAPGDLRSHVSRPLPVLIQQACLGAAVTSASADLSAVTADSLEFGIRQKGVSFVEVVSSRSKCLEAASLAEAGEWSAARERLMEAERSCQVVKRSDPSNHQVPTPTAHIMHRPRTQTYITTRLQ
jgi:hypothetical protein